MTKIDDMLKYFHLIESQGMIDIELFIYENLPNKIMNIQGIFIQILEKHLLVEQIQLVFKDYSTGYR